MMLKLMELLDMLPDIKEKSLTTEKRLVLHPDGKIDLETEKMKELELLVKGYVRDKMLIDGRKIKKKIEDFRVKRSITEYEKLVDYLNNISLAITVEEGRPKIYAGILSVDEKEKVRFKKVEPLSDSANKIFNDGIKFYKLVNSAHLKTFFCPSQFFYETEYFDKKSLDALLTIDGYKKDEPKSKYIKLKSSDGRNKLNIGLYLNKDEVLLQYIALGHKEGDKRSKMHIVSAFDYHGKFKGIYHLEQLVIESEELKIMNFEEEAISYVDTGVPGIELIRHLFDYKTSEFKTDMKTNEVFFLNEAANGDKHRLGNKDVGKYFPHYELILKKPILLGGPFYECISNFVSENAKELNKIREKKYKRIN